MQRQACQQATRWDVPVLQHWQQLVKQHTSSFSALPVLEWCLLCECFLHMPTPLKIHYLPKAMLRRVSSVLEAYVSCADAYREQYLENSHPKPHLVIYLRVEHAESVKGANLS